MSPLPSSTLAKRQWMLHLFPVQFAPRETEMLAVRLNHRAVLEIAGEDRRSFLQGLVSNDMAKVGPDRAVWAAFLTPQGKFVHDLFIAEQGESLLLDVEAARAEEFRKKLSLHRLRAQVTVAVRSDLSVWAAFGDGTAAALGLPDEAGAAAVFNVPSCASGVAFMDPRLVAAGARLLVAGEGVAGFAVADLPAWDAMRIRLGLPDGSRDLPVDKGILLENGFDELGGVDFKKGCYLGQELTSRTKYRGLVRKRLMPVTIEGPAPAAGTPVMLGEAEAGEMRSSSGDVGLALIRLEYFRQAEGQPGAFTCGDARLTPSRPDWAVFPEVG
jgi:folate-binding protein YgfZ